MRINNFTVVTRGHNAELSGWPSKRGKPSRGVKAVGQTQKKRACLPVLCSDWLAQLDVFQKISPVEGKTIFEVFLPRTCETLPI